MSRVSQQEIEAAFGAGPKSDAPGSAVESAVAGIRDLDRRMEELVEKRRQPHETHEQAYVRVISETPAVMDAYERERRKVLKGGGFGDGVE